MQNRYERELEESERTINHIFQQITTNETEQEEINGILKELEHITDDESLFHLVGPALVHEKKEEARMELKDKMSTLKTQEAELNAQLDEERERHDKLQTKVLSNK